MISVIIPVYNVEKLLRQCLDSVLAQTYTDLEIILVDDGSTDASLSICREYAQKDPRIRVIHQENRGQSAARNVGLDAARGEFIGFVDSDDYILPDMYETLMRLHREHDADLCAVGMNALREGDGDVPKPLPSSVHGVEVFEGDARMEALFQKSKIRNSPCDKLYARAIFDGLRYAEGQICEDMRLIHRIVDAAQRIAVTDHAGYIYRMRGDTTMSSKIRQRDFVPLDILGEQQAFVGEHYPQLLQFFPKQLCHYGMMFTIRTAVDHFSDPEIDRRLQRILRENLSAYLKSRHRRKYKIVAFAGAINIHLGRAFVRFVRKIRPGSLNIRW